MIVGASGSLGDTAIMIAKLHAPESPVSPREATAVHATSRRHSDKLCDSIRAFYGYQGIEDVEIIKVDHGLTWLKENPERYDVHVTSSWYADGDWEMPPHPPLWFRKRPGVDLVLCISAGWDLSRGYSVPDLAVRLRHCRRKITICGWTGPEVEEELSGLPNVNCRVNDTDMADFVDILMSANQLVCCPGFAAYVGALGGAQLYCNERHAAYFHPEWDVTWISGIEDSNLDDVFK